MIEINTLSIVIPVYNEERTITKIFNKLKDLELINNIKKELIFVDDSSNDRSIEIIEGFIALYPEMNIKIYRHILNKGKGAALRTGINHAQGEVLIVQDADLEYDPNEINLLLKPIIDGFADVVYGSRFRGGKPHRVLFFWHSIGNHFLTFLSNMFTNLNLT